MAVQIVISKILEGEKRNQKYQKCAFAMYEGKSTYVNLGGFKAHVGEPFIAEVGKNDKGIILTLVDYGYERQGSDGHRLKDNFYNLPDGDYTLNVIENAWQDYYYLNEIRVDSSCLRGNCRNFKSGDKYIKENGKIRNISGENRYAEEEEKARAKRREISERRAAILRTWLGKRVWITKTVVSDWGGQGDDSWIDSYEKPFILNFWGFNDDVVIFEGNGEYYAVWTSDFNGGKWMDFPSKQIPKLEMMRETSDDIMASECDGSVNLHRNIETADSALVEVYTKTISSH